jgi:hypothetical protein
MQVTQILAEIDQEISRLQQVRALLADETPRRAYGPRKATGPRKRKISPEGRRRIAEAMKRRWAERKKQGGVAAKQAK